MTLLDPRGKHVARAYTTPGYVEEETLLEASRQTDRDSVGDGYAAQFQSLITMFELSQKVGGSWVVQYRWHPGTSQGLADLVWDGNTYNAMPIEASGFEMDGSGKLPRPSLKVSNIGGIIGQAARSYGDFIGWRVTRIRTLGRFLDAVNFTGGNPTADPTQKYPDDVFYIERKTVETYDSIEWELSSVLDLSGVQLPVRLTIPNVCIWAYKSTRCGYVNGMGNPPDESKCDKGLDTINGCKAHFGENATLPFGGFPGCGRFR